MATLLRLAIATAVGAAVFTGAGVGVAFAFQPHMVSALLGLWRVQADSLHRHLTDGCPPAEVHDAVMADLRRAARLLDEGIGPWDRRRG